MKTKNSLLLILLIIIDMSVNAQIPNNGFENWKTVGNCLEPSGWNSANTFDSLGSYFPITRSSDHYPATVGNYSIKIENNISLLPNWNALGVAWSGNFDNPGKPSFPITGHPTSFCGYYKFFPQNKDTMYINLVLFLNGNPLDSARISDTVTVSTWKSFNIPIPTYVSADSGKITLSSYFADKEKYVPHGNSILYVDNLSFDNLITSVQEQSSKNILFDLYPNPTTNSITIEAPYQAEIEILDIQGQLVKTFTITGNKTSIDVSALSSGVYVVEMKTEKWIAVSKFIKE
jgi:hypothetical protein